jgi:hypothetical protein
LPATPKIGIYRHPLYGRAELNECSFNPVYSPVVQLSRLPHRAKQTKRQVKQ